MESGVQVSLVLWAVQLWVLFLSLVREFLKNVQLDRSRLQDVTSPVDMVLEAFNMESVE